MTWICPDCGRDDLPSPDHFCTGREVTLMTTKMDRPTAEERIARTPGLVTWLARNRRGLSSEAIATHLTGVTIGSGDEKHYPHDPGDLGRCIRLLDAVPSFRPRMSEMATAGREWAALAAQWGQLETSYRCELNGGNGMAPKTYALMRRLINEAR